MVLASSVLAFPSLPLLLTLALCLFGKDTVALSVRCVMEWNISLRSSYRDEECPVMAVCFLAFFHDSCQFRADGMPTSSAAAIVPVYLALAFFSTAPEVTLCCYSRRRMLGRRQSRGSARAESSMQAAPSVLLFSSRKPDHLVTMVMVREEDRSGRLLSICIQADTCPTEDDGLSPTLRRMECPDYW